MSFKDFNFKTFIQEALDEIKFKEPTPVQQKLIPVVRSGRDLVGESKTGSGKTHTFLLPIFEKLNPKSGDVQVVITAPSRELATQIYQATKQIAKHSDTEIRVVNYVGGTDKQRQIEKLKVAQPHIVIGTPGRIYDLVKSGDLAIHKAHTFVVDEADMTMDMGFLDTVDKIAASLPKEVQILVFSATIPQKLQPFLKKYLTNPVMEQIKTSTVIADTIDNWLVSTKGRNKNEQILEMLKGMQPYLAMIFVNTKERADDLHSYLVSNGLKVAKIHGGIPPRERKRIMNQVKKLDFEYIVATDLAARGIDIEGVSHVINDAIPQKLQPFLKKYLTNPVMEQIKTSTVIADTIDNWLVSTKGRNKNEQILEMLKGMQPYLAMIFVNTKERADDLHSYLVSNGLKVAKIHGGIPPRERKRIMNQVKKLDFEYIVATDLAARGIDIEGVSHVINDAIPQDLSFFVHRVGRTGRNGLSGTAITLYQPSDDSDIRELEKMGITFDPKVYKDGEFQDTYDRDRRANREKAYQKLDTEMIGLVKKKKKKIKPGYKKKIQWKVDEKRKRERRAANRAKGRAERKAKKQSF